MSGSTMIMAPAMETSSSGLSRSHSTPDLMGLSSYEYDNSHDRKPRQDSDSNFNVPSFDNSFKLDTSFFVKDDSTSTSEAPPDAWRPSEPEPEPEANLSQTVRRSRAGSLMDRPRSWFPSSRAVNKDSLSEQARPITSSGEEGSGDKLTSSSGRNLSVQDSIANFAKRSWLSSSGSPSPKRRPNSNGTMSKDDSEKRALPKSPTHRPTDLAADSQAAQNRLSEPTRPSKTFTRASSYFSKIKQKQSRSSKKSSNNPESDNSCASSATSLAPPASNTTEARTSQSTSRESATTVTDDSSTDMPPLPPQNRDPLWSSFKNLEVEYKGFTTKTTPQRIVQVQTIVLPFLRSTIDHPSTQELLPEDVDRRATILNKWWGALLDMMDGIGMGSVPGVDRPIIFDTLTTIMMRPEWRQTTSHFLPLVERSPRERVRSRSLTNASETTDSSDQAIFLIESAEHNVRTMFVANLVKQMGFVVDKLAMRHAPLTLVNFAGKACAYAFFFAPGVADVLVRLWGLGPELIRRAADELGLPRRNKGESDDIVALFPPKLAQFGWTSPKAMWNLLKQVPRMPIVVSRIPWTGPWVSRWKGRDTDLLFVFFKQFHVLSNEFMPPELPLTEKARSPGFLLIQAQLLSIIDNTVHRQAAFNGMNMMDPMPGADASAMAMPLPPPNVMKGMSENSLIMLLKEMLLDHYPEVGGVRHTFAEACSAMIKASVRRTSQFDSAACFTLCDFLEEALVIFDAFEDPIAPKNYIDWPFWLDVFKKISNSMNTMSEVRMLSFIFSIWDAVTRDPSRKSAICLDWLLTEEVFNTFFNHWCPMVRAYYHRLLCWRICRCEGDADEVDSNIYLVVSARLKTNWSHYLYLKQTAEETGRYPPSTAPTVPTPGKKFMIIRQEVNQPQPGLFVNFDSFAKTLGNDVITADDPLDAPKADPKKKKSLLDKVLSFTSGGSSGSSSPKGHSKKLSWDEEFANARRETAESRSRANPPPRISVNGGMDGSDSACSSPLYEEQKYIFKFILAWQQPAMPPRERVLTRPRLPAPAQAVVSLWAHASTDETVPRTTSTDSASSDQSITTTETSSSVDEIQGRVPEPVTQPEKPTGTFSKNAVYCGRALAEWAQVVWECNNFVDRRRDEGVPGLHEVEVPILGVEGFRKIGG